ncbi:MAG: hypothetical protein JNJ90_16430 [Saprospiraceae bacterium]|nr:hypothetical protein [Saprospiraceae bacterium]
MAGAMRTTFSLISYLRPMQHREIFTTKYLREIGKHFDLLRDVPNLDAVRQHVPNWQVSHHNGTIIRQSEIQLQKEFLHTFFVGCLGYRGKIQVLALQEQIRATDRRIDDMVFDLYGLTAEERALVLGEGRA